MPNAEMELPYDGAKEMLLVDDVDNKEFLRELLEAMYSELPAPKKRFREVNRTDRLLRFSSAESLPAADHSYWIPLPCLVLSHHISFG